MNLRWYAWVCMHNKLMLTASFRLLFSYYICIEISELIARRLPNWMLTLLWQCLGICATLSYFVSWIIEYNCRSFLLPCKITGEGERFSMLQWYFNRSVFKYLILDVFIRFIDIAALTRKYDFIQFYEPWEKRKWYQSMQLMRIEQKKVSRENYTGKIRRTFREMFENVPIGFSMKKKHFSSVPGIFPMFWKKMLHFWIPNHFLNHPPNNLFVGHLSNLHFQRINRRILSNHSVVGMLISWTFILNRFFFIMNRIEISQSIGRYSFKIMVR